MTTFAPVPAPAPAPVPAPTLALLAVALLAAPLTACVEPDDLETFDGTELRSGSGIHDAAADFSDLNPNGVWSYGYGVVGDDFTAAPDFATSGPFDYRGGGVTSDGWRGFHKNTTEQVQQRHTGLFFDPGALVMHPGNSANHLAILRFTAPAAGCYDVDATWTAIDQQAKNSWTWVYSNAGGQGFQELHTQGLSGYGSTASFSDMIEMGAGEVLAFEVGNGGDGYFDDSVELELTVTEVACPAQKYFLETFEGVDAGPNLVDLQSAYIVENGSAHRADIIGHGYLGTEETDYNEGDWTMTADWHLAPWDMPYIGIGAAIPSNFNWVVGTPDQSVYLQVDTHQPWGNPGSIYLVVQSAGWDRQWVRIGDFVGGWGQYSVEVSKAGDAVTFSFYDPNDALMGGGTIDDLTVSAPWLNDQNSRLFVGSIRGNNYNVHSYWDNFEVTGN